MRSLFLRSLSENIPVLIFLRMSLTQNWVKKDLKIFLPDITFSSEDILKIIQKFDSEEAYGYGKISIRMLTIYGPSICKSLETILKSS